MARVLPLGRGGQKQKPAVDSLLAEIQSLYEDAKTGLRGRDAISMMNMAFYRGLQWGVSTEYGWFPQTDDTGESQEVYNYIRPTVRSAVASMLRAMPNPSAVAAHSDQRSMTRAIATQNLMRSILRNNTIPFEELVRGETEAACKGATWYKIYFDPNAGKVRQSVKRKPVIADGGGVDWEIDVDPKTGMPQYADQFEGDIRVEFRDIVDVVPDPNATKESEIGYLFDRKLMSMWKLDDHFPVDIYGQPTKNRWTAFSRDTSVYERDLVENPQRRRGMAGSGGRAQANQLCEVVEYWEQPTRRNPKGRLVVWSGDVIVAMSHELPYEWPWVLRNGQNIVPNALYADGVVYDLIAIQKTINLNASKKREWMDKILSPPMLIPYAAAISVDNFTDVAGELINYETGHKPEWMQVPSIPSGMFELENSLLSILKDVSTYSDISRGDAPQGIETGRALAYLNEFQQGVREPDVLLFKQTIIRMVRKCLSLMRDYFPDGRLMKMLGPNDRWQMREFKREDYDFEAEIEIEMDSGAPNSRALRMAEMSELFQLGAFNDTPQAARFRKMMQIDYVDRSTIDVDELQRNLCRAELDHLMGDELGFALVAREQEDHAIFLEELERFRISQDYFSLSNVGQVKVDDYVHQHEEMYAEQQANVAQQQAILAGGGAPSPAPGQQPAPPQRASPPDGGTGPLAGAVPQQMNDAASPDPQMTDVAGNLA